MESNYYFPHEILGVALDVGAYLVFFPYNQDSVLYMEFALKLGAVLLLGAFIAPLSAKGAECDSNFVSNGNFFSGQTFNTFFVIQSANPSSAFAAIHRQLVKESMAIQHVDQTALVLTAWNVGSRPERPYLLTVVAEQDEKGAKLSFSYSLPKGAFSPADVIQKEFCRIAAVASASAFEPEKLQSSSRVLNAAVESGNSLSTHSGDSKGLCLGGACLGMTIEAAAELPLVDQSNRFKIKSNAEYSDSYGLNSKGLRIKFDAGYADREWIRKYSAAVKIPCSLSTVYAEMKAGDGQKIKLMFDPAFVNGKGGLRLTSISRSLALSMSQSQRKDLEQQARARYGAAFGANPYLEPHVKIDWGIGGSYMYIATPTEAGNVKMMEQPGCSDKASLD